MAEPLLMIDDLVKRYAGIIATDHFCFRLEESDFCAIIGPNGAGKSTLMSQISGELLPDSGRVVFAGTDVTDAPVHRRASLGFARSFQITSIFPEFTVLQNVALAVQVKSGHSFRFWRNAAFDSDLTEPAYQYLEEVGLQGRAEAIAANLSHGEKRALEIAIALAREPRLLLLDEPMAGMGPDESARMIELLRSLKGRITTILIEHDMDAVFALSENIVVLVSGRCVARGDAEAIRNNPEVRKAYLGEGERAC